MFWEIKKNKASCKCKQLNWKKNQLNITYTGTDKAKLQGWFILQKKRNSFVQSYLHHVTVKSRSILHAIKVHWNEYLMEPTMHNIHVRFES